MGALGHTLEREGIATTQISLVREHTEAIRPPRALWVPFDLGRPLGAPSDAAFQTRVLRAALRLLEARSGPVLEDFPEEAPGSEGEQAPWSCPIPLPRMAADAGDPGEAFERELGQILPWYALALERRGRTTVGLSGLDPPAVGVFLRALLGEELPESPIPGTPLGMALKHAAEDLKAIYTEAALAQPGGGNAADPAGPPSVASDALRRWFWHETRAGELLLAVRARLAESEDRGLALVARLMLVPYSEL